MLIHKLEHPATPHRVVLFGASGFFARDLARQLQNERVEHVTLGSAQVDLSRPQSVEQVKALLRPEDALVILSALTPEKGKDVPTFMTNILMIAHVCAALENRPCHHLLYVSSDGVYADSEAFISEETAPSPNGLYPMMHAAREQMLENATAKSGVPLCIVRPCAVYGPGDTHNSYGPNRFIRAAHSSGKITLFGSGEEERDHVYIRDVSAFLMLCLKHRAQGIYNITSGQSISFSDLATLTAQLSPRAVTIERLPRSAPITHRRFDVSLRRKLFPQFETVSLETGLSSMVRAIFGQ